jgi:hypothetical protein
MVMRLVGFVILIMIGINLGAHAQTREDYPASAERLDLIKSVEIFPNPASEFVHVRVGQFKAQDLKLSIHNIIGNEVPVETEIVDEHELRVKVKDLTTGYYLLALKDADSKFRGTYKFLKR